MTLHGAVFEDCDVVGGVELKLGKVNDKKMTSKVSGSITLLDGKKYSIKAQTVDVDDGSPVDVYLPVKSLGVMHVTIGGGQFAGSLGDWHVQSAEVGGNWTSSDAAVYVDFAGGDDLPDGVQDWLLPDGEPVLVNGGKWSFKKAAGVKLAKDKETKEYDLVVDDSKGKTNLSGLKLTYTPKTGMFKGSFKVYALEESNGKTKLKKYTANVVGFVVDGVGVGQASIKKPAGGPWSVRVE